MLYIFSDLSVLLVGVKVFVLQIFSFCNSLYMCIVPLSFRGSMASFSTDEMELLNSILLFLSSLCNLWSWLSKTTSMSLRKSAGI